MFRELDLSAGARRPNANWLSVFRLGVLGALLAWAPVALAQPVPLWHNTLENDAAATIDGGVLMGDPPTYASGQVSPPLTTTNKFVSANPGFSWVDWGTTEVQTIFDGWVDDDGITVDLYFSGVDSSIRLPDEDSGFWSVGHRVGDNFVLVGLRGPTVRINFRNDTGGDTTHSATTGGGFIPTETYRLTLRQHSSLAGGAELYLDDLNGNVYDSATPLPLAWDVPLPDGYVFNFPLEEGGGTGDDPLGMNIGNRRPFGSLEASLKFGEALDEVRIFNGNFTPAQLDTAAAFDADFDNDGDVDGDDFLLWRTGFPTPSGATKMDGDADNDGDVDGDDFLRWQTEFPSPGSGASSAVPEPNTLLLVALCAIAWAASRTQIRRQREKRIVSIERPVDLSVDGWL